MPGKPSGAPLGPVFLRICLGVVFLWLALGNILSTTTVSGRDAAALRDMGVTAATASLEDQPLNPNALVVSNLYLTALALKNADHELPVWPQSFTRGPRPVIAAYLYVTVQLVAGALVLIGALTRLSALALSIATLATIWVNHIGPAIASGKTTLGFLPAHEAFAQQWQPLILQFILLGSSLALVSLGAGCLGFDKLLFPRSAPKPKPQAAE